MTGYMLGAAIELDPAPYEPQPKPTVVLNTWAARRGLGLDAPLCFKIAALYVGVLQ